MARKGEGEYLGSHSPVIAKGEAETILPASSFFHRDVPLAASTSLLGGKNGNKQNTQWVKQNKEVITECILFLSSLGRTARWK